MELDLCQRSPLLTQVVVPKRLANHREGLSNQMARAGSRGECRAHGLVQLLMERGRSKTCSCEAERVRG